MLADYTLGQTSANRTKLIRLFASDDENQVLRLLLLICIMKKISVLIMAPEFSPWSM